MLEHTKRQVKVSPTVTESRAKILANPAYRVAAIPVACREMLRFSESHIVFRSKPGSRQYPSRP